MPKLLFSKIRICEFKDLIKNGRQSMGLRLDIVVSRKAQKRDIQSILHNKTKDDTYPSKISFRDNTKHHPNLERLLRDKKCLSAFRTFLQSEFSEENIEFWLACEDFRKSPSTDGLSSKADEIYQDFLHPSSQREINVDHYIREKIQKSLVKPSLSCFDDAQRHVYQLMERDSCSRFLRSDAYLSLRRRNRTLWYI